MNYALYAQHRVRPSQNFRLTRKVINNMKKVCSLVVAVIASLMVTVGASATALDDLAPSGASQTSISQSTTQPPTPSGTSSGQQVASGNGNDVGTVFSEMKPDTDTAKELVSPIVKWVNIGIGVGVAILGIILLAITVLDLLYIVSPSFIRNLGSGGAVQAGGMSPMGGMGGAPAPQPATGFASLISDDCKAALAESGVGGVAPQAGGMSPMGGMSGMGGMGGFGGGGFGGMGGMGGMGGFGGAQAAAPAPSKKAVAMVYLKKRVFTFVLIGICAVVLTCTCFLDVGTWLGTQILNAVSGIGH